MYISANNPWMQLMLAYQNLMMSMPWGWGWGWGDDMFDD
jgi:hypothetical protein